MEEKHFCFNTGALGEIWGRIHVPLARQCSLRCEYCSYKTDGNVTGDLWRPGTAGSTVESEAEIRAYLEEKLRKFSGVRIIGVSGPGDPLENMTALRTLVTVMTRDFPDTYLCICTNGSVYNADVQWLLEQKVLRYITLTVNTMDPGKYPLIYGRYKDPAVPRDMWENQRRILSACRENGVKVKINTVFLRGINDLEIPALYAALGQEGVSCFNLMPHIDTKTGKDRDGDACHALQCSLLRQNFPMMTRCKHCRADHCECGASRKE